MSIREFAVGLGALFVLAACWVVMAGEGGAKFQNVLLLNGMAAVHLGAVLVPRETWRPNALLGAKPESPPRPAAATFLTAAAFGAAGWLTTSLALLDDYRWLSWFAAFAGLLVLGAVMILVRWRFSSISPVLLLFAAFVLFSFTL